MAYVIGRRALFLHVPKTGGKSVLASFERAGMMPRPLRSPGFHVGHATERQCYDKRYRYVFVFGFVRHPVEWWESLWKFAETPGSSLFEIDPRVDHPFDSILPYIERGLPLSEFVSRLITEKPGFYSGMLDRYFGPDLELVDFIGRTDLFKLSMRRVVYRAKLPVRRRRARYIENPVHINKSAPGSAGVWEDSVRTEVLRSESKVIDRFWNGVYTGEGRRRR